jgi:L-alanine-DL-glutamate epimerase-like enolase superfamily enzyme
MPDPLRAWVLGTDEDRQVLAADLLSIEDLKVLDRTLGGHHAETFRRRARNGKRPGFRLGKRWLFRPTIEDLARLNALRQASQEAQ